ncbi:MAG: PEP-CTERM sorting domain-containing protein [Phycisphaerae bacterium]
MIDHPDAAQDPPPYGLRLDDLFLQAPVLGNVPNPVGGVTSFSFDPTNGGDMTLSVITAGTALNINISGTAFGGVDTGTTYGFGAGLYAIDFTYTMNVTAVPGVDGGWVVSPNNAMNNGTITALAGVADIAEGTSWQLFDQVDSANDALVFLQDEHRLGGFPALAALDPWVGRGWVTYNSDGTNSSATQDWLFIAIPEPSSLGLLVMGAAALLRRKRAVI